ncbi:hypothetical protein Dimus_032692 [Dionaea muscipula]
MVVIIKVAIAMVALALEIMSVLLILVPMPVPSHGLDVDELRNLTAAGIRGTIAAGAGCLLVFGDSSVDPGNNNHLATSTKSNFPPYGLDFTNRRPTGRFSNGMLTTDFIARFLWGNESIEMLAFLDPNLKEADLPNGVSFASAGSGYDELTANLSSVLSMSRQLEYFLHYKLQLRRFVGNKKAEEIIDNALFVISLGSNDLLQNYFIEPDRQKQYTLPRYQDFLVTSMARTIRELHRQGAKRLVVVGLPPLGCMPFIRTISIANGSQCAESFNEAAYSFNSKIQRKLSTIAASLNLKTLYADVYAVMHRAIHNPADYGFTETLKGCCGSGTYEYGETCRGLSACADRSKYVFWDAIHPSESMYKILADEILKSVTQDFFL